MINNEGTILREPWQIERQKRRVHFLVSSGVPKAKFERGEIETDGGNIFYNGVRVGIFEDDKNNKIVLFSTDYGCESEINLRQLELVIKFRGTLNQKKIPYEEKPLRKYVRESLSVQKSRLSVLENLI